MTLRNCARTLVALEEEECHLANTKINFESLRMHRAFEYFSQARECDPTDPVTLFQFGCFLEQCEKFAMAEEYYLQVLELDSNFVEALHAYGSFLQERGEFSWAEKFYDRIMQVKYDEGLSVIAPTSAISPSTSYNSLVAAGSSTSSTTSSSSSSSSSSSKDKDKKRKK